MNSKYGSNVNSDKVVKMLVATLVAAVLAASPAIIPQAFAGNPHEVPSSGNPVGCAIVTTAGSGGGTIDHINCTGDLNGLGGQGTAHAVITASGTLDLACINPSGGGDTYSHDTKPPGLRSTAAGVSGAQDVNVNGGHAFFDLSTGDPTVSKGCPGKQLLFEDYTIDCSTSSFTVTTSSGGTFTKSPAC